MDTTKSQTATCGTQTQAGTRTPTGTRLACTDKPGHIDNHDSAHGTPVGTSGWFTWTS